MMNALRQNLRQHDSTFHKAVKVPALEGGITIASCLAALLAAFAILYMPGGHNIAFGDHWVPAVMFSLIFASFPIYCRKWLGTVVGLLVLIPICTGLQQLSYDLGLRPLPGIVLTSGLCIAAGYGSLRPRWIPLGFMVGIVVVAAFVLIGWGAHHIWPRRITRIELSTAVTVLSFGPVTGIIVSLPIRYLARRR